MCHLGEGLYSSNFVLDCVQENVKDSMALQEKMADQVASALYGFNCCPLAWNY